MIGLRFSNVMDETDYPSFPWDATPEAKTFNLWSYIDSRDGAQAVRRALEADLTGFEAFVIASPDTVMDTPTIELVERFVPDIDAAPERHRRRQLAALEREGPRAARLRTRAQLARPRS